MAAWARSRSWFWLVAVTPAAAFSLLYACGRFASEVEATDGGSDGANGADVELAIPDSSQPMDAADAADAVAKADAADGADGSCFYTGPGGGSSTSGGCTSAELYSCQGATVKLECGCPDAGCTCGTKKFSFDCVSGCAIGAAQRQLCGLPLSAGASTASSASSSGM